MTSEGGGDPCAWVRACHLLASPAVSPHNPLGHSARRLKIKHPGYSEEDGGRRLQGAHGEESRQRSRHHPCSQGVAGLPLDVGKGVTPQCSPGKAPAVQLCICLSALLHPRVKSKSPNWNNKYIIHIPPSLPASWWTWQIVRAVFMLNLGIWPWTVLGT